MPSTVLKFQSFSRHLEEKTEAQKGLTASEEVKLG